MHGILQDSKLNVTSKMWEVEGRVQIDGTYLLSRNGNVYPVELKSGYIVGKGTLNPSDTVPGGLFGRWTDRNEGTDLNGKPTKPIVYWDEVELIDNLYEAMEVGQSRGELAIWDCAGNSEIRV